MGADVERTAQEQVARLQHSRDHTRVDLMSSLIDARDPETGERLETIDIESEGAAAI